MLVEMPTELFSDAALAIFNSADPTKQVMFDVSGVAAGQTRVITMPNYDMTLVDWTNATQDFATSGDMMLSDSVLTLTGKDSTLSNLDAPDVLVVLGGAGYMAGIDPASKGGGLSFTGGPGGYNTGYLLAGDGGDLEFQGGSPGVDGGGGPGSYGNILFNELGGNLGVGVADPDTIVEIMEAGIQLKLSYDGTNYVTFATQSNSDLRLISAASFGDVNLILNKMGLYQESKVIAIQPTETDQQAIFRIMPKGAPSPYFSSFELYGTDYRADSANYERLSIYCYSNDFRIHTSKGGTGSVRILYLGTDSYRVNQVILRTDGGVDMPQVYGDTVGGTNRDLYIDDTGKLGYVSSSQMYKKNIQDYSDSSKILQLRPVIYDRIDGTATGEVGLIAEEVEVIMPEAVSYKRKEVITKISDGLDGEIDQVVYEQTSIPETVNHSRLIVPMISEYQKLEQRVQALEVA